MEPTQPTTTNNPQPPISKKSLPFLLILLSLLLVLSLASTAYLAYQNMQLQKEVAMMKQVPSPAPTPTPTVYPTTSWQQFTEDWYLKYTIKYPSEMTVKLNDSKNKLALIGDKVTITIQSLSSPLPAEEIIAKYSKGQVYPAKFSASNIHGVITSSSCQEGYCRYYVFKKDNLVGGIITEQYTDEQHFKDNQNLPDQILSTLTFAHQSSMQTFTSTKIPGYTYPVFTIDYPQSWTIQTTNSTNDVYAYVLTNGAYKLHIAQPPTSGIVCVFSDSVKPSEGTNQEDLTNVEYTELHTGIGILRRYVQPDGTDQNRNTLNLCQKEPYGNVFVRPTQIGIIFYELPTKYDTGVLKQMDTILSSIQTK